MSSPQIPPPPPREQQKRQRVRPQSDRSWLAWVVSLGVGVAAVAELTPRSAGTGTDHPLEVCR